MGYRISRGTGVLGRLIVPRCRHSVNVVILNEAFVVETYLNGAIEQHGRVLMEECGRH